MGEADGEGYEGPITTAEHARTKQPPGGRKTSSLLGGIHTYGFEVLIVVVAVIGQPQGIDVIPPIEQPPLRLLSSAMRRVVVPALATRALVLPGLHGSRQHGFEATALTKTTQRTTCEEQIVPSGSAMHAQTARSEQGSPEAAPPEAIGSSIHGAERGFSKPCPIFGGTVIGSEVIIEVGLYTGQEGL